MVGPKYMVGRIWTNKHFFCLMGSKFWEFASPYMWCSGGENCLACERSQDRSPAKANSEFTPVPPFSHMGISKITPPPEGYNMIFSCVS